MIKGLLENIEINELKNNSKIHLELFSAEQLADTENEASSIDERFRILMRSFVSIKGPKVGLLLFPDDWIPSKRNEEQMDTGHSALMNDTLIEALQWLKETLQNQRQLHSIEGAYALIALIRTPDPLIEESSFLAASDACPLFDNDYHVMHAMNEFSFHTRAELRRLQIESQGNPKNHASTPFVYHHRNYSLQNSNYTLLPFSELCNNALLHTIGNHLGELSFDEQSYFTDLSNLKISTPIPLSHPDFLITAPLTLQTLLDTPVSPFLSNTGAANKPMSLFIPATICKHQLDTLLQYKFLLVHGPEGCGKSLFLYAMIHATHRFTLKFDIPTVIHSIVGKSQVILREGFAQAAKAKPSLIVIDDLDELFGTSENASSFLQELQTAFAYLLDMYLSQNLSVVATCRCAPHALPNSILHRVEHCLFLKARDSTTTAF